MELTPFDIYLIFQADHLLSFFKTTAIIFLVLTIGFTFFGLAAVSENVLTLSAFKKILGSLVVVCFVFGVIHTVVPRTSTLIAMYSIPAIISVDGVDKLPKNFVTTLNTIMEKYNREMEKEE